MNNQNSHEVDFSMKWFDFLTKAGLFIIMAVDVIFAAAIIIDPLKIFKSIPESGIFKGAPIMMIISIIYGVFLLGMAVFAFITRKKLLAHSVKGPVYYSKFIIIGSAGHVVYNLLARIGAYSPFVFDLPSRLKQWFPGKKFSVNTTAINVWLVVISYIVIALLLLFIFANKSYFDNRSKMFDKE